LQHRLLNYGFYFVLVLVFVLAAGPLEKVQILLALFVSYLVAYLCFVSRWLSLDGARAATVLGTITLGIGGWEATAYLLVFFISSNLIAAVFQIGPAYQNQAFKLTERRTATQVWANGFWFIIFIIASYTLPFESLLIGGFSAIAAANSDTWATLFGSLSKEKKVWLITTRKPVPKGTDGGVSTMGFAGALLGAVTVALVSLLFNPAFPVMTAFVIFAAGFSGCLADSYFGASFQQSGKPIRLRKQHIYIGNDSVNWLATGTGAFAGFLLYNILYYALV